jgi:ADP-heptose:LPS heptosyltransferase
LAVDVLERNQYVDEVIFFQQYAGGDIKNIFLNLKRSITGKLKIFFCYPIFILKNVLSRIDIGISLGNFHEAGTFSNILFDLLGIRKTIGCFGDYPELLSKNIDKNLLKKHWTDIYVGIIDVLVGGVKEKEIDLSMSYEITNDEKELIEKDLQQKGLYEPYSISIIHPGGSMQINSRLWGYEKFSEIADHLYQKYNMSIFISGSKEELQLANLVSEKMVSPSFVVAGEYTFPMVASLLQKAKVCITNDTSILHLADAMGTEKVISLWGPSNSKKSGPRSHRNIFIQSDLECSPCYFPIHANEELTRCDRLIKEECLKNISVYEVINKIDNELTNILP